VKYLLIPLLLASACLGDPGPRVDRTYLDYLPGQLEYEEYVFDRIAGFTGWELTPEVTVYWSIQPCPIPEWSEYSAVVHKGECHHGITIDCDEIYVAHRGPVEDSALAHEAGHCARMQAGVDPDWNHKLDPKYWEKVQEL